jgi:hypothetical protein
VRDVSSSEKIDVLLQRWRECRTSEECTSVFREILHYLAENWIYLVSWSSFEAWGKYYVSPDRKRCIYVAMNPRVEPTLRVVDEIKFNDPGELANKIWLDQKGVISFERIRERVKAVFGVDVEMDGKNKFIRALFGEAPY